MALWKAVGCEVTRQPVGALAMVLQVAVALVLAAAVDIVIDHAQ